MCACAQLFSCVRLFATPWTVAHQAPLSMEFSRQEHWSGLPFPSPGVLPHSGNEPTSLALAGRCFTPEPPGKPVYTYAGLFIYIYINIYINIYIFGDASLSHVTWKCRATSPEGSSRDSAAEGWRWPCVSSAIYLSPNSSSMFIFLNQILIKYFKRI